MSIDRRTCASFHKRAQQLQLLKSQSEFIQFCGGRSAVSITRKFSAAFAGWSFRPSRSYGAVKINGPEGAALGSMFYPGLVEHRAISPLPRAVRTKKRTGEFLHRLMANFNPGFGEPEAGFGAFGYFQLRAAFCRHKVVDGLHSQYEMRL